MIVSQGSVYRLCGADSGVRAAGELFRFSFLTVGPTHGAGMFFFSKLMSYVAFKKKAFAQVRPDDREMLKGGEMWDFQQFRRTKLGGG